MIYEYALEPEMVAAWGDRHNHRFFIREFGLGSGRLVSRYPKKWAKKVWDAFAVGNDMDKKRLEELLIRLQETKIKRKDYVWDDEKSWLENALLEHGRHPFRAVLAKNNPTNRPEILSEDALAIIPCPNWDNHHGVNVNRNALEMRAVVEMMLARCRWVKFIDPHISPREYRYQQSLSAFFAILAGERPVGPPESVEIHIGPDSGNENFHREEFGKILPVGLKVILFQWQEKPGGQALHNRYILTDIGGVSFHHGLDIGANGEKDDITRLDPEQYILHCKQYDLTEPAFDQAADPIELTGILGTH